MTIDTIFAQAAAASGKTEAELRAMAPQVFATMLHHAMQVPDRAIWTVIQIGECGFYLEVDVPRRSAEKRGEAFDAAERSACHGCNAMDVDLVEVENRNLCPSCVAELAEERHA